MRGIAIVALAVSVLSDCDAMLFGCEERILGDTNLTSRVNKPRDVIYIAMLFPPTSPQPADTEAANRDILR